MTSTVVVAERASSTQGGLRLALVGLIAPLAAGAGLAVSRDQGSSVGPGPVAEVAATPPATSLPALVIPEGKVPVAFDDGGMPGIAGFIDEASENMDAPRPVLDLGSGRLPARGWEVTDVDGVLVGYFIGGFVDLETARDVEAMDALLAERAARAEAGRMTEEEMERILEEGPPPPERAAAVGGLGGQVPQERGWEAAGGG
jgi:hypothetical protein